MPNFRGANLFKVTFQNLDLTNLDFQNTNLQMANFQGADLKKVNFQRAFLLVTNLRGRNLDEATFGGETPPFLCNVFLPSELEDKIDRNRDCEKIPQVRSDRNKQITLSEAKQQVDNYCYKTYDELLQVNEAN